MPYFVQSNPFRVPTTDDKIILEHFGNATTNSKNISIAHMVAPSGWSEPFQNPDFDEYTLVSKGKKLFEIDGDKVTVHAGESILIKKGSRVRYSNPYNEPCEYWSVCLPAFSIDTVNRES